MTVSPCAPTPDEFRAGWSNGIAKARALAVERSPHDAAARPRRLCGGNGRFPTIHRLRAVRLPRLTDGYAPRCLVAEAVAGLAKDRVGRAARRHGVDFRVDKRPKRVKPMGARWSGGAYRVKYRLLACDCDPYVQVTAVRGRKRIRFQIGTV